jgi:aminoglycoside phosphotransferase (APT) family kinase protein
MRSDPDPRFSTIARFVPVPPFFSSSVERIELVRAVIGAEVPRVLAEGRFASGNHYTVMTMLDGKPWDPAMLESAARRRALSRELGALTARLHSARLAAAPSADTWARQCAEALHCAADHLPGFIVGPPARRHRLHARVHRAVQRLMTLDLGPFVLAHCDLHPSNLLFDAEDRVRAVFDFQLSCPGPAAMDFRWLCLLEADVFLDSYGRDPRTEDEASWLGHFFDMMWLALALVAQVRHYEVPPSRDFLVPHARQLAYLLRLLENDRLRRGPRWIRSALLRSLHCGYALRYRATGPHRSR